MGEAVEIANFGHPGDGMCPGESAEGHEGLDQRQARPEFDLLFDGGIQSFNARRRILGGDDQFFKRDLLAGKGELLGAQVIHMFGGPGGFPGVAASITQEKTLDALAAAAEVLDGPEAAADEVADGLVGLIGNVDERQFAGAEQPGEFQGVAAVGFDADRGLFWDERRRDDLAVDFQFAEMACEPEAGRSGLVDVADGGAAFGELLMEPVDGVAVGRDVAVTFQFAGGVGDGDGDGFGMDIEADVFDRPFVGDVFIMFNLLLTSRSDPSNHNPVALGSAQAEFNPCKRNASPTLSPAVRNHTV